MASLVNVEPDVQDIEHGSRLAGLVSQRKKKTITIVDHDGKHHEVVIWSHTIMRDGTTAEDALKSIGSEAFAELMTEDEKRYFSGEHVLYPDVEDGQKLIYVFSPPGFST